MNKNQQEISDTFLTQYWPKLDDGRIQCDVCPRECKLHEGQQGLCFVRANKNDQIVLTTYGRSSGFCVDPIEKKPLNHFLPGTPVLSFGTAGCNLACKFCQNWDMSKSREMDILADQASPEKIPTNILADRLKRLEHSGLIRRELYQERPKRYAYYLTEKGLDLEPVMRSLIVWSNKHIADTIKLEDIPKESAD